MLVAPASLPVRAASPQVPARPDGISHESTTAVEPTIALEGEGISLSLNDAVRLALRHSPALDAFAWSAESAMARIQQARLWPNPEIEFERENFGGSGRFSGSVGSEDMLSLSQVLPLGGDLKNRRLLAEAAHEQAAWDYHAARLDVVLDAAQRYIDVLAADRRRELARRGLNLARELESVAQKRVENGVASPVENIRVIVPVVSAELESTRADLARTAARRRLALLIGEHDVTFDRLSGDLGTLGELPSPDQLVGLVNDSPAVARWAAEISARQAERALGRSQNIPDPVIRLGIKQDRTTDDYGLVVGVSLPLPLFDRNQGTIQAARFAERAAHEQRRAAELRLESALSTHYFSIAVAHAEANALRDRALPAAESAYQATLKAFREGELAYIDVLEAGRSFLVLEGRYLEALVDYHSARAALNALLGGQLAHGKI